LALLEHLRLAQLGRASSQRSLEWVAGAGHVALFAVSLPKSTLTKDGLVCNSA
jgi:hypothetical protein